MLLRLYGRLLIAIALLIASVMLHIGLCEWVITPRLLGSNETVLWWIRDEPVPATPIPSNPRAKVVNPVYGRFLKARFAATGPEGWVYGVVAPIIFVAVATALFMPARRLLRLSRGRCPSCGYDLRFDASRGCSECGWRGMTWPSI
jgi:hypothetical protein